MKRILSVVLILFTVSAAAASDAVLSGNDGHPRDRLPLTLYVPSFGAPPLDEAASRAVDDWNRVARDALGVNVFTLGTTAADANVVVTITPGTARGPMGVADVESGTAGVITLPVRISVAEPAARGATPAATLLYQVLAHELGHALGLAHNTDPRSLMCCVYAGLDFNDPAVRAAYVEARRNPDVGSVRAQLDAHYQRFWRK